MIPMNNINTLYQYRGFNITQSNTDGEFEPISAGLLGIGITLNTLSREKNIPEAERNVRTVKGRVWSVLTTIHFCKVPDRTIIEIVLVQVSWLNLFPNKYGVYKTMIPRQIMSGLQIDYHFHCRIYCGQYVQTHKQHSKNMMERTVGDVALRPTGHLQGGYKFI